MSQTLVRMPRLADTLVEGTLGQWLKRVGDEVRQGEPLASIETDKVTTELTSPAAGTLLEVLVSDGQTVPIETPIARIGDSAPAETPSGPAEAPSRPAEAASPPAEEPSPVAPLRAERLSPREPAAPPRRATPVAARLLAEHGLKPEDVGTPSGRVTKDDVLSFVARGARVGRPGPDAHTAPAVTAAPDGELVPLTTMRRAIAEHMLKARQSIPHGQTVMDVDLTQV